MMRNYRFFIAILLITVTILPLLGFKSEERYLPVITAIAREDYRDAINLLDGFENQKSAEIMGIRGIVSYMLGDFESAATQFAVAQSTSDLFLAGAVLTDLQNRNIISAAQKADYLNNNNAQFLTLKFIAYLNNNDYQKAAAMYEKAEDLKVDTPVFLLSSYFFLRSIGDNSKAKDCLEKYYSGDYKEGSVSLPINMNKTENFEYNERAVNEKKEVYIEVEKQQSGSYCYTVKNIPSETFAVQFRNYRQDIAAFTINPYRMYTFEQYTRLNVILFDAKGNTVALSDEVVVKTGYYDNLSALENMALATIFPEKAPKGWLRKLLEVHLIDENTFGAISALEAFIISGNFENTYISTLNRLYTKVGICPPPVGRVFTGNANKKQVSLTFDDGPNPIYTPIILDILDKYNAKATFFVVGKMADRYPDLVREILKRGHEVANHSQTHPNITKLTDNQVLSELLECRLGVRVMTEEEMTFFRPPGGNINTQLEQSINKLGFTVAYWSVNAGEFVKNTPEVQVSKMAAKAKNGAVFLMHNGPVDGTMVILAPLLSTLSASGYKCVTMRDLL